MAGLPIKPALLEALVAQLKRLNERIAQLNAQPATPSRAEGLRALEREVHTAGRILAGDEVTAQARGTFVPLSPERVMRLLER